VSLLNRDEISSSIKKKGGRRLDDIWEYVNKGESLGGGHYKASCKWCGGGWTRGRLQDMKVHLARICKDVPENIKNLWRNYLAENTSSNTKNKRTINQPTITSHFHSNTPISSAKAHLLDQAILKAWFCCGFAFHTIENPFIIDLFQIAAPGYNLPSREKLSGFLLESEAARIEQKVEFELDNEENLTLTNLIASDFCELESIKPIISNCSAILKFFQSSHIAHGYYQEQLKAMKIKGGEIKSYTKTRWGSFCMTVDSIIRSKPVFDWILDNYPSVISNDNVFNYLQNEDFYMKSDCFIGLVKLAAAINQIDGMNPWKQEITVKFNRRFNEFTNYYYILSYWLHPYIIGLKNDVLDKIYEAAASLWKENPTMWWLSINTDKNNDQLQELALHLYAISPSQAVCEHNFSTLKWIYGDYRAKLSIYKVEAMCKIHSYYISNLVKS
ncbi:22105_t:CDS:2, partial [Entrophospora sp. SA101]